MARTPARPPALLLSANYQGTLAAARSLGRAGVRVTVADPDPWAFAAWSRHVGRRLRCPDLAADPEGFVGWLLEHGRREPGQVLCTTSDDVAWLVARHQRELGEHYLLDVPSADTIYRVLNKTRLEQACRAVGVPVPDSWLPADDAELDRLRRVVRYPLVVKPQTQVLLWPHQKGRLVQAADELAGLYADFRAATHYAPMLLASDRGVSRPILQAYEDAALQGVYSLSGFTDASGETFLVAGTRKVFQRPRRLGIGLCFEEAEVLPEVADRLQALCREVGFHGVFEVEYLVAGDRHLLIDFNPRFYGQMGFEVDRGLDLPLLAYLAAAGDGPGLQAAVASARQALARPSGRRRVYCHRVQMRIFLVLLSLARRLDATEARRCDEWLERGDKTRQLDAGDWWPMAVEATSTVIHYLAHPRSTWLAARRG